MKITNAERLRAMREIRRNAGLCIHCGAPAREGKTLCGQCAERNNTAGKKWRLKPDVYPYFLEINRAQNQRRRAARIAAGLCPECGGENRTEYRLCPRCHERQNEYMRAWRERRKKQK